MRQRRIVILLSLALITCYVESSSEDTMSLIHGGTSTIQSENVTQSLNNKTNPPVRNKNAEDFNNRILGSPIQLSPLDSQVTNDRNILDFSKPKIVEESAYTITSHDFAVKTSSSSLNNESKAKNTTDVSLNTPLQSGKTEPISEYKEQEFKDSWNGELKIPSNKTLRSNNTADEKLRNPRVGNVSLDSRPQNLRLNETKDIRENMIEITPMDKSKEISNTLNSLIRHLEIVWRNLKYEANRTSEAANVLTDYKDKIAISEAANMTDCVKNDVKNYKNRMEELEGIFDVCDSNIKKKEWVEFRQTNLELLNRMSDSIRETNNSAENTMPSEQDFDRMSKVESDANIHTLNLNNIKEKCLEIETNSFRDYEEIYKKCIEQRTKHAIVVDTLTDIMRIKNNCVG